jgi:hypothetical protein
MRTRSSASRDWEQSQIDAAAREAAAIGGRAGDEGLDPALRPLVEAGEGVSEGFELAEAGLIEAAEDRDAWTDLDLTAFPAEREADRSTAAYGEADHEDSSEIGQHER